MVRLGQEKNDRFYSHGKSQTRLAIQRVIKSAVTARSKSLQGEREKRFVSFANI